MTNPREIAEGLSEAAVGTKVKFDYTALRFPSFLESLAAGRDATPADRAAPRDGFPRSAMPPQHRIPTSYSAGGQAALRRAL